MRLVLSIFASLAEFDRETILEKTRAGQLLAKGKHIGRPAGVNQQNFEKSKDGIGKVDVSSSNC